MGFQLQEAEHDLHASAFHVAREADIRGFVKSGFQFNQRRHRLAQFRRLDQRLDDRAVFGCAIQSLLDRHHIWVLRGLANELHNHIKTLIGMVNENILGTNGRKTIAAMFANALGKTGTEGFKLKLGRPMRDNLNGLREPDKTLHNNHIARVNIHFVNNQSTQ